MSINPEELRHKVFLVRTNDDIINEDKYVQLIIKPFK